MSEDFKLLSWVRCDADGCGWITEEKVHISDWIGKPCPRCGADVINNTDVLLAQSLELLGQLGAIDNASSDDPKKITVCTDRRSKP